MNIFTYGSLMFPDVWLRVAGATFPTQPATLLDFTAWRVRGETYPGLAPAAGEHTAGILHLDVSEEAAARLDVFEGAFYERRTVKVIVPEAITLEAHAYVVAPDHRHELEPVRWQADEFRRHHIAHFLGPKAME